MKNLLILLLVLAAALAASGCQGLGGDADRVGWLDPDRIEPTLFPLLDDYQAYVEAGKRPDGSPLSENGQAGRLFAIGEVRAVIVAAQEAKAAALAAPAAPPPLPVGGEGGER